MAKYQASPLYSVRINDKKSVVFDHTGFYSTEEGDEFLVLDTLCPIWIKRVDEPKRPEPSAPEAAAPAPVAEKPARKSSGK
jgi:hypothetical protein